MTVKIIYVEAETMREAKAQVKSQMPEGFHTLIIESNPWRMGIKRNKQVIESEADSLEEAIQQLKSQLPEGFGFHYLLNDHNSIDGELEELVRKLYSDVPDNWLVEWLSPHIISDGKPITTDTLLIQREADSLEQAREQVRSQMPEGYQLHYEVIISDGKPITVTDVADTTETAFANAQRRIPRNADILEKKELVSPERRKVTVEGFDERTANSTARAEANKQFGSSAAVQSIHMVMAGKKGILGFGNRPDQYEAEVLVQRATVEVTYKPKARISATIGKVDRPKAKISAEIEEVVYEPKAKFTAIISDITMDERTLIRYWTDYPDQSLKNASFLISTHGKPIGIYIGGRSAHIFFRDGTEYFLGGFKVGYIGTGPDYSQRLLELAGFHVSMDEITTSNSVFVIAEQGRE